MGSISRQLTPLVIHSLKGGHTHTHTHSHTHIHMQTHTYGHPHRINFKKPGTYRLQAGMPGLKMPTAFNTLLTVLQFKVVTRKSATDST